MKDEERGMVNEGLFWGGIAGLEKSGCISLAWLYTALHVGILFGKEVGLLTFGLFGQIWTDTKRSRIDEFKTR